MSHSRGRIARPGGRRSVTAWQQVFAVSLLFPLLLAVVVAGLESERPVVAAGATAVAGERSAPAAMADGDGAGADDTLRLLARVRHLPEGFDPRSSERWSVRELRFSADGGQLLTRAEPSSPRLARELLLWETGSGRLLSRISCGPHRLSTCDLSPGARRVLAGAADDEELAGGEIRLIDVQTGTVARRFESSIGLARFLPGGEVITLTRFATSDVLRRIQSATGQETARSVLPLSYRREISRGGDLLLAAVSQRDSRLKLITTSTGDVRCTLAGCSRTPAALAIAEDGCLCAASAGDGGILVWESETGELLHRLAGHAGRTTALAFSRDSRQLAAGGADGQLTVWHMSSGQQMTAVRSHQRLVATVAFTADGRRLASGSFDGTAAIWSTGGMRAPVLVAGPVNDNLVEQIWQDLASSVVARAWLAIGQIDEQPAPLVAGLHRKLRDVLLPDQDGRIGRLLRDLDSTDFRTRHRATRELRDLRQLARPALLRTLNQTRSAEVRSRVRRILGSGADGPRFDEHYHRRLKRLILAARRHVRDDSTGLLKLIVQEYPERSVVRAAEQALAARQQ